MSTYRILRQITCLGVASYACTVMAIREDPAGKNEFRVKLCVDAAEAQRAAEVLEAGIRDRIYARGGSVVAGARAGAKARSAG